ncbi:MAG: orotidine-5'-phosphate decarboxylase [Nitrospinae bacterium]|nr:orotidine-5'-phosphate decarboxylase [Nitrospinota bacterium]
MKPTADERLIVALDVPTAAEAARWARRLSQAVKHFKIGLELFTGAGPAAFKSIPGGVFLDLKFFDIPNTMAGALNAAAALKPFLVNVHALAGPAALEQCARAVKAQKPRPKLLAVTILTSFTGTELKKIGVNIPMEKMVSRLCGIALEAGCDGVVASPLEAPRLRKEYGKNFLIVTPGVRPAWSAKNDQQRVTTPADAIKNGADYIVVGRPILSAPKPLEAARMVIEEIRLAGGGKKR